MAPFECKVQYLDDTDPFNSTTFPEPSRPPTYSFQPNIPLCNQISGLHKLLRAPHNVRNCFGRVLIEIQSTVLLHTIMDCANKNYSLIARS